MQRKAQLLFLAVAATATACPAMPVMAADLSFSGYYSNDTPPPAPDPSCPPGRVLLTINPGNSTQVSASNFGVFTAALSHCATLPPFSYTGGAWRFDFEVGDWIGGTAAGDIAATAIPDLFDIVVTYTVTGGDGRFLGASGEIQGVGTLDRRVPRPINYQELSGTISAPAVPEPASWAMMIAGFALAGAAMRRGAGARRLPSGRATPARLAFSLVR